MNAMKADLVRTHLVGVGLTHDDCEKYTQLLRRFLAARLTKAKFEVEMLKIVPREKVFAHNAIIRDLLFRAQQKRDGVPDLPTVMSVPEKPPQKHVPPIKRPRPAPEPETEPELRANGPTVPPSVPKPPEKQEKIIPKPPPEESSVAHPRRPAPTPRPPGPVVHPPRPQAVPTISSNDVPTYNVLPYFPVPPGQIMDFELFLKLRQRMKKMVVEDMGLSGGVKDDAVALLLHGLEAHVKSLMEAGVRHRAAREALRPRGNLVCGPVGGHDLREAALRNSTMLGEEAGVDLERLTMLLY